MLQMRKMQTIDKSIVNCVLKTVDQSDFVWPIIVFVCDCVWPIMALILILPSPPGGSAEVSREPALAKNYTNILVMSLWNRMGWKPHKLWYLSCYFRNNGRMRSGKRYCEYLHCPTSRSNDSQVDPDYRDKFLPVMFWKKLKIIFLQNLSWLLEQLERFQKRENHQNLNHH